MNLLRTVLVLTSSTLALSGALAQVVTPPPSGIPNGLSGPGGTVTFSEAPTINASPAAVIPVVPRGSVPTSGQSLPKPHVHKR